MMMAAAASLGLIGRSLIRITNYAARTLREGFAFQKSIMPP